MKLKKHLGATLALALVFAAPLAGMSNAFANGKHTEEPGSEEEGAASPYTGTTDAYGNAYITKALKTINGQSIDETFTFTFTPESNEPALDPVTIKINSDTTDYKADGATVTYYGVSNNLMEMITTAKGKGLFSNNGIYKYAVAETAGSTPKMTYDKTAYTLIVLVSGDNTTIQVVQRTEPSKDAGKKIDPTNKTKVETKIKQGNKTSSVNTSDFVFNNTYKLDPKDSDLNQGTMSFEKVAVGFANPDQEYTFEISFVSPVENGVAAITAAAPTTSAGTPVESAEAPKNNNGTFNVTLKANQKIAFSNIQEGTLYSVKETSTGKWTAKVASASDLVTGDASQLGEATLPPAAKGSAFTINFENTNRTIVLNKTASAKITNEWDTNNPTGLVINNLPFVLMIGIPVLVAAGYVVLRRKGVQI